MSLSDTQAPLFGSCGAEVARKVERRNVMQTLGKNNVIYFFRPDCRFVYQVEDGETFWVETDDCYNGLFKKESDLRTEDVDTSRFDAAVGPIEVRGATTRDTLCVEVVEIQLANQGVMVTAKNLGIFGNMIDQPNTKILPIRDGCAVFSDRIRLPLTPMIGVMGVLPEQGQFRCTVPGDFGGNMDTKELTVGTKAYFPVFVDGAGLAVSDLHACMGDGEMSGTGLEIAGRICLRVSLLKGQSIRRPVLETPDAVYTIATKATFEDALRTAAMDMVCILQRRLGLNFPDAYRLLSAACDIRISQVVNGVYTLKARVPKSLLGGNT